MPRKKSLILFFLVSLFVSHPASSTTVDSFYESLLNYVHFFPEYHMKVDLTTFAFHKSVYFKQQYLAEFNTGLEFAMISFKDLIYSIWYVNSKIGLGDIPGNNVFSVLNIHFNISPTLEARFSKLYFFAGYNHLCVHEVDRKNYPVIYYNAPWIGIGSPNMRIVRYWNILAETSKPSLRSRFGWCFSYMNFLKDGFGLVNPDKVNGFNPYSHEVRGDGRYAVYIRRSWIVTVHEQFRIGRYDRVPNFIDHDGWYWVQRCGTEIFYRKGLRGAAMYYDFILDDLPMVKAINGQYLPVFSKDRLVEMGLTFFF